MVFWWVTSVLINVLCDSCPGAVQPLASGVQMPANAAVATLLHVAAIISRCKPKILLTPEQKIIVCIVFTTLPEQGGLGVRVLGCKPLPGVLPAQPQGQSGTGAPSQHPQHQTCVPSPQGSIFTTQLLLTPAQDPGGYVCAKLKCSCSGDMSALPRCQVGQHVVWIAAGKEVRDEMHTEKESTTGRVKAKSNRVLLALSK